MDGINCIKFLLLICKFVLKFAPDCGVKTSLGGTEKFQKLKF